MADAEVDNVIEGKTSQSEVFHEWSLYYDDSGNAFYHNSLTGESRWDPPGDFS